MKIFTIMMFAVATGVISSVSGLHFTEEPVKYIVINLPLTACFGGIIELITAK